RPHRLTLLPYTTLFRSINDVECAVGSELEIDRAKIDIGRVQQVGHLLRGESGALLVHAVLLGALEADGVVDEPIALGLIRKMARSEEHTSELQSRENLV